MPNSSHKIDVLPFKTGVSRIEPRAGDAVFINPRIENPLDFLFLNLDTTSNFGFHFVPFADDENTVEWKKGDYTKSILELNNRAYLVKARKNAYKNYRASLIEWIEARKKKMTIEHLEAIKLNFLEGDHKTVWLEMKRQHQTVPELHLLFSVAPEALNW